MVLVGKVEGRQDGLEFVENLIVFGHVSGQNTSAGRREEEEHNRLWWSVTVCVLRDSGGRSHLMIPSLMRLYWSADRFRKMLLWVYETERSLLFLFGQWSEDAKTTNCRLNHTKYFISAGVFYYSRSVSRPWPQSYTWNLCKNYRVQKCFCIFVFSIKIAFFMLLYLLKYFKCHSAVVVLQGGDVIVPEGEFSPSIYLQRDGHPFPINNNHILHSVTVCDNCNLDNFGSKNSTRSVDETHYIMNFSFKACSLYTKITTYSHPRCLKGAFKPSS